MERMLLYSENREIKCGGISSGRWEYIVGIPCKAGAVKQGVQTARVSAAIWS